MDRDTYCHVGKFAIPKRAAQGLLPRWVLSVVVVILSLADGAGQTTYTWTGGGGAGNQQWSKNNNWSGVGAPADNTTNVFVFSGAAREFSPDNDRTNLSAASIVFATNSSTNAQGYNLVGHGLELLGGVTNLSTRWHTISLDLALAATAVPFDTAAGNLTLAGRVGGAGSLVKTGAGTLVLSAGNSFRGGVNVHSGVLELAAVSGAAAGSVSSVSVSKGAVLLLSQGNQVNDAAALTLSGGTIRRAGAVSEVFGNLTLTAPSFLDFGTGAPGTVGFGIYTPSALLTVENFFQGNVLTFRQDLSDSIDNRSLFVFDNGFTAAWNGSTFTITAIPEPSTLIAVAALLAMMVWPSRRTILRDFKRIVGLRAPMRDRLARMRER